MSCTACWRRFRRRRSASSSQAGTSTRHTTTATATARTTPSRLQRRRRRAPEQLHEARRGSTSAVCRDSSVLRAHGRRRTANSGVRYLLRAGERTHEHEQEYSGSDVFRNGTQPTRTTAFDDRNDLLDEPSARLRRRRGWLVRRMLLAADVVGLGVAFACVE